MSYYTHGHSIGRGTPTYKTWTMMWQRCSNENAPDYSRYGGRGISVCERWASFENFLADMGERPVGSSLDRVDSDRGYEPDNCRWATARQQQNNLKSNVRIVHAGRELTLAEWSRDLSLSYSALKQRRRAGDRPPRLFRSIESKFSRKRTEVLG